jgi:hypothetical protein
MRGKAISLSQIRELLCKKCLAEVERPGGCTVDEICEDCVAKVYFTAKADEPN